MAAATSNYTQVAHRHHIVAKMNIVIASRERKIDQPNTRLREQTQIGTLRRILGRTLGKHQSEREFLPLLSYNQP